MVRASIATLFFLGLVAALMLGISSKILAVEENPKVEAVLDALPGANCGGCGYAGCEGYAVAVVNKPEIAANLCIVGGDKVSIVVGELTDKRVAASEPQISYRRCEKVEGKVAVRCQYVGVPSCAAAALLASGNGPDQCAYSCLGHGDCVKACPFDALYLKDGLVEVNAQCCTGCGACTKVCPRSVLEIIPRRARVMVGCSTKDKGKAVTEICETGCIKCMRCIKACPAEAVRMEDGIIHINQTQCLSYGAECGMACVDSCPRHIFLALCMRASKQESIPAEPQGEQANA